MTAILLDHTIERGWPVAAARRIALGAVDELQAQERAAVISTLPPGRSYQFTTDRETLRDAIATTPIGSWQVKNSMEDSQCLCGVCTLDTIRNVAAALQHLPNRKVLLFVGSTIEVSSTSRTGPGHDCAMRTQRATDEMFAAIRRANLVIHAIDPGGTRTPAAYAAGTRGASLTPQGASAALANLQILADRAGGRAVLSDNRPELAVPDLLTESDTYYLVGFYPSADEGPRGFRPVDVQVRRSGARVITRCGYDPSRVGVGNTARTGEEPAGPAAGTSGTASTSKC